MTTNEIVKKYIDAWNQRNVTSLLELMHAGAAYYDAFWMETCVGRDLEQYFQDAVNEEPYWYEQVGSVINTGNGVVFRYSAHERKGRTIGDPIHFGAEILALRDDKIVNVTDIYCSTDQASLEEIAEIAAGRHGLPAHANRGLGALKAARIKESLSARIGKDRVFLDPDITVSELADKIGCTLDQLSAVLEKQFGTTPRAFFDTQRIEYAKELLESNPDDPDILEKVANTAGFRSIGEFERKFTDTVGVTPNSFWLRRKQNKSPENDSYSH